VRRVVVALTFRSVLRAAVRAQNRHRTPPRNVIDEPDVSRLARPVRCAFLGRALATRDEPAGRHEIGQAGQYVSWSRR
jgi:hypothetical protein